MPGSDRAIHDFRQQVRLEVVRAVKAGVGGVQTGQKVVHQGEELRVFRHRLRTPGVLRPHDRPVQAVEAGIVEVVPDRLAQSGIVLVIRHRSRRRKTGGGWHRLCMAEASARQQGESQRGRPKRRGAASPPGGGGHHGSVDDPVLTGVF